MATFKYSLQPNTTQVERLLNKGYYGRSPQNEIYFGGNLADNFHLMGQAVDYQPKNRNFSALNLSPVEKRNIIDQSYIRNNLPVPNRGYSALGSQMNAMNLLPSGSGQINNNQNVPPNRKNSLLNFISSPRGQGYAQGLLEAGAYSEMPVNMAEALALANKRGNEAVATDRATKLQDEKFAFEKSQATIQNLFTQQGLDLELQKLLQPQLSSFAKDLIAVGIDPNSPEGRDMLMKKLQSATTNITMTDSDIQKEKLKYAIGTLTEERKIYNSSTELDGRLQIMEAKLRDEDFETGLLQQFLLPFSRTMAAMGLLDESEIEQLADMEFFQAASTYMIPRMRAIGSGATSDFEVQLYTQAAPNIGNTKEGNIFIVAGMRAINKFNKKKFREMEKWVNKNNSLVGFEEYFEKEFGDTVFKQASTDEEFDQMVKDGKLNEGDLFLNKKTNKFVVITNDMLQIEEAE